MKQVLTFSPTFTPASKTLDFSAYSTFSLKRLYAVVNETRNQIIYCPTLGSAYGYSSFTSGVLTLSFDTSSHSSGDVLSVIYDKNPSIDLLGTDGSTYSEALSDAEGNTMVGNLRAKFKDTFYGGSLPDSTLWDVSWTNQGSGFVVAGGDSAGAGYLNIALDPTKADSEYVLTTKSSFKLPIRFVTAVTQSQRQLGQELEVSLVGVDNTGAVETIPTVANLAISGTVTATASVATINFATKHGLKGGDRVVLYGNSDSRLNIGPVQVTPVTAFQITVPFSTGAATYTAGGYVKWVDPAGYAKNVTGLLFESSLITTASAVSRKNGSSARLSTGVTVTSMQASRTYGADYTDSFAAYGAAEIMLNSLETNIFTRNIDTFQPSYANVFKQNQTTPDASKSYKLRFRARNLANNTIPVAKIVSISKSGTTTATITLDRDVSTILNTASYISISGVRDITNFPNTASVVVSSVSTNTITAVMSGAVTASSAGGAIVLSQGGTTMAGASGLSVQNISRTNNILTITMNTAATNALPGEWWDLYGCDATSMGLYDASYKVLRMTGSIYEVESIGADFTTINCGGYFFRRSTHRIHLAQELSYAAQQVELQQMHGVSDGARALPCVLTPNSSTNVFGNTGTGQTAPNPINIGGRDQSSLLRNFFTDTVGHQAVIGAGEVVGSFSLSSGNATPVDGTSSKTIVVPSRESDFYMSIATASTTTIPTMQAEYSFDNINFSVMPLQRIDNTAASTQYGHATTAITALLASVYKGKTYGAPYIRLHAIANTISGSYRVVPQPEVAGVTVSPFTFSAANTTEAAGVANGAVQTGGVRTLAVSGKGSTKAYLIVDASSGTTGTNTIVLEGAQSASQTTWDSIPMQPLAGGPTATSASFTSLLTQPAGGIWEADVSQYLFVRARASAVMTTTPSIHGALKLVNVPSALGLGTVRKPTYAVSSTGLTHTGSTNLVVIESGASKVTTIKRMVVCGGTATAATIGTITVNRNTVAASAAGTTPVAATLQRVTTDPAFTGVVRTGAFTVVGVTTTATSIVLPVITGTVTAIPGVLVYDFTNGGTEEGLTIPVGVTNGVMFTHSGGGTGAANESITVEWTEE